MAHDLAVAATVPSDRRDAILHAIAYAAEALLADTSWRSRVDEVLRILGEATDVDRVYVFRNHVAGDGTLLSSQQWEWAAPGVEPQIANADLQSVPFREAGFERWMDLLDAGAAVHGDIADFPDAEREFLAVQGISSMVVVPIVVTGTWWGFMGFDATGEPRGWSASEVDALRAAAGVLGAGIGQHDVVEELRASRASFAEAYRREREATERLREADQLKDRFLETVSHELRTPLTAIEGTVELLRGRGELLTAEQHDELLGSLAANTKRLHHRMEDLLELDRLRGDDAELSPTVVRVAALIEQVLTDCQPLRRRRVDVTCEVDEAVVDADAIERILMNLLLNAAVHTPDHARLWIRAERPGDGRIVLVVEDDGPGVPDEAREVVFRAFEHGPGRRAHAPGTGLGLSIVKHLAELHGGSAWVLPRHGGGASFHVLLSEPAD